MQDFGKGKGPKLLVFVPAESECPFQSSPCRNLPWFGFLIVSGKIKKWQLEAPWEWFSNWELGLSSGKEKEIRKKESPKPSSLNWLHLGKKSAWAPRLKQTKDISHILGLFPKEIPCLTYVGSMQQYDGNNYKGSNEIGRRETAGRRPWNKIFSLI